VASNGGSATITLGGTGSAPAATPVPTASPTSLTYGSHGSTGPKTVTVTNTGSGVLTLGTLTMGGANPGDFTRSGTCAGG
jgi:hypothetical protein